LCWWEEGEKRGRGGWVRDLKLGQLTLTTGKERAEVRSYVQRATIPSKRVVYTLKYSHITTHAIINNMYLFRDVKYIFSSAG
jgi:hypothetical protein